MPTDKDLRDVVEFDDSDTTLTRERSPLETTAQIVRKKLAKRRTKKKAKRLKRRKRRQQSSTRRAARKIGSGLKRAAKQADEAAQEIAASQQRQRERDVAMFRDAQGEFADDPGELRPAVTPMGSDMTDRRMGGRMGTRGRRRAPLNFGAPIQDADAEPMDRNPAVGSFLDRDPDGDERDTGVDRAIGPFDYF